MRVDSFEFELPKELIAQEPARPRDSARLLRVGERSTLHGMLDLPGLLRPGDLLVVNDTRVLPTRFRAGRVEVTLVEPVGDDRWLAFARPGRLLRAGDPLLLADGLAAEVVTKLEDGRLELRFALAGSALMEAIERSGAMPLPPYIKRHDGSTANDRDDYQTRFAREPGAVAAPTAGLHFTERLLAALEARGVARTSVTLHVGLGTFAPIRVDDTRDHVMHEERYIVSPAAAEAIATARARGGRIVSIGTTVLRTLECGSRNRRDTCRRRTNPSLHHAGLAVSHCRPPADQLPFAALDAVHARLRLCRHRAPATRLRAGHPRAAAFLLLRRRLPDRAQRHRSWRKLSVLLSPHILAEVDHVADLVAIVYPDEHRGTEVMVALRRMQKEYLVDLEDACVVIRKPDGAVKLEQAVNLTGMGAAGGAVWGALIGLIFLNPLLGAAAGAAAGALGGKLSDYGIRDDFMKGLADRMQPGSSALFMLIRKATYDKVEPELARIRPPHPLQQPGRPRGREAERATGAGQPGRGAARGPCRLTSRSAEAVPGRMAPAADLA